MIKQLVLIFLAGIVIDLLVARYTRAVADRKIWSATSLSGLVTMANFLLLTIIINESAMNGFLSILSFAGGNTVGTYIGMRRA